MENFGEIFTIMTSEKLNKMCIDCKKPYPLYVSINNGVFLCNTCADQHKAYGTDISFIRYLKDPWDEYLLSYMYRGGNKRFLSFIEEFNIPEDMDASQKYFTKGIDYYRKILRSEVLAEEPPEKLDINEGNQIYQDIEGIKYPEFENNNYVLMGESNLELSDIKLEEVNNEVENKDFKSKMSNLFKKVGKEFEKKAKLISDKFKDMEITDKIKSTGQKAFVIMKKAGKFVVKKSKPMYEKISEKTKESATSLTIKSKEIYSDLKYKLTGKETVDKPTSDYYELSARPQASNENIIMYIEEKENAPVMPVVCETSMERNNSFRLLSESMESQGQVEERPGVLPTLQEIQKEELPKEK